MKFCVHCGKEIPDQANICMLCGCRADAECTVTFQRKWQFFLWNPAVQIEISGEGLKKELAIKNGETLSVQLPVGAYQLRFYASIRETVCDLKLEDAVTYHIGWNRFSGKLEAWEI